MGADRFHVFYGLRFHLTADVDAIDEINESEDPRFIAAKKGKLNYLIGRLTDGEPHFLFIGRSLGIYGVQDKHEKSFSMIELQSVAVDTDRTLQQVGLDGTPKFWFQLEAQY